MLPLVSVMSWGVGVPLCCPGLWASQGIEGQARDGERAKAWQETAQPSERGAREPLARRVLTLFSGKAP